MLRFSWSWAGHSFTPEMKFEYDLMNEADFPSLNIASGVDGDEVTEGIPDPYADQSPRIKVPEMVYTQDPPYDTSVVEIGEKVLILPRIFCRLPHCLCCPHGGAAACCSVFHCYIFVLLQPPVRAPGLGEALEGRVQARRRITGSELIAVETSRGLEREVYSDGSLCACLDSHHSFPHPLISRTFAPSPPRHPSVSHHSVPTTLARAYSSRPFCPVWCAFFLYWCT
jgi:hypothetical protein